jgi:hypothetical protein
MAYEIMPLSKVSPRTTGRGVTSMEDSAPIDYKPFPLIQKPEAEKMTAY